MRHFFRAGGASQTIAKAMSAYDKDFSNAIYGPEPGNRFVCESRLKNMLRHEYGLIIDRLDRQEHPTKRFFTFANTVTTSTFENPHGGHGWMGVRFQTAPTSPPAMSSSTSGCTIRTSASSKSASACSA